MTRPARSRTSFVKPQLATLTDAAPIGRPWWFETKYDGYRMQGQVTRDGVRLISRNGIEWTDRFPDIAAEVRETFRGLPIVVDGEIVMHEKGGRSSFHALQRSLGEHDTGRARYMLFDVLSVRGADQRARPLSERRALLDALRERLLARGALRVSRLLRGPGAAALARACARGEEGIICKRADAPYESGRTKSWLKVKCGRRQEFVVVGFSEPKGARTGSRVVAAGGYRRGGARSGSRALGATATCRGGVVH